MCNVERNTPLGRELASDHHRLRFPLDFTTGVVEADDGDKVEETGLLRCRAPKKETTRTICSGGVWCEE